MDEFGLNGFLSEVASLLAACCDFECDILRRKLSFLRAPILKSCYAGAVEIAFPIFHGNRLSGVMFTGPFRHVSAPESCAVLSQRRRRDCKASISGLPVLDLASSEAFLSFGSLIAKAVGDFVCLGEVVSEPDYPSDAKVLDFIDREFRRPDVYLRELASFLGFGQTSLCQMLKRRFGKSFSELLTERRMEHARYLLKDSFLKTEFISSECGYKDSAYFYRMFKRENAGVTPSGYRRRFAKRSKKDLDAMI